jgi:hypothetical protein
VTTLIMKSFLQKIKNSFFYSVESSLKRIERKQEYMNTDQVSQVILKNQYKTLSAEDLKKFNFNEIGFRKYSQNSEDGILLFIFSLIDVTNKKCVEICASDGIQSNTANLIINHGWHALLFDGNIELVNKGKKFYAAHPDTFTYPPVFVHAWVTKDNVNDLIRDNGFTGNIDLLSLDIDGVDYWIWETINVINPRVVVAEVQCIWGAEKSVTVPYQDNFRAQYINGFGVYSGASLPAFTKLANKKGYRLIGIERYGFNAFFMRNDVGCNIFPEIDISSCVNTPFINWAQKELLPLVKDKLWLEV